MIHKLSHLRKAKAQVSMELIMYTFISLILFTTYFLFISSYIKQDVSQSIEDAGQNLAYKIAEDVNLVYILGEGYHFNITLPSTVANHNYQVQIEGNKLMLSIPSIPSSYLYPLLFNSSSLYLQPGRVNEIYNSDGRIRVHIY